MKTIRKPLAILLALTMLLTLLTACGKSPAQSFFDLYEEAAKVTDSDFDMTLQLKIDDTSANATLTGSNYSNSKQASVTGSIGIDYGIGKLEIAIPEILVDDKTVYINVNDLVKLLQLLDGEDYSGVFDAEYIEFSAESETASQDALEALGKLASGTGEKVKADILARKDAVVKNSDGSFTLTLDGVAMLDLAKIIMEDLSANRKDYIDTLLELSPDTETLSEDRLNELWDTFEDALDNLKEDLSAEDEDELKAMTLTMTIGKNKDNSYAIGTEFSYDGDQAFLLSVSQTLTPVKNPETFTAPTSTISAEELSQLADALDDGDDDYSWDLDDDDSDDGDDRDDDDAQIADYLLDTKRVGNDEAGYIDVPSDFVVFQEEGGLDSPVESFQYSDSSGKTVFTVTAFDGVTAEDAVALLLESMESNGCEEADSALDTIAGYDAYQVYGYYPEDNTFLVTWVFDAPDHDDYLHYLAIEFDAVSYVDVWLLSETFSFSAVSDGLPADDDTGYEDADSEERTVDDLNLSAVDSDISEFTYLSYDGKELKVPVLNNADWDEAFISSSLTMVDVAAKDYGWSVTYSSEDTDAYDLSNVVESYTSAFVEAGYEMSSSDVITSADGKAQLCVFYGEISGNLIADYMITVDYGDELATLDLTIFNSDTASAKPILDYLGLTDPVPAN